MPICIKCGRNVSADTQPGQDNSTFICEECQSLVDLKVLEAELGNLKKLGTKATPSQLRRLAYIEDLIQKIKAQG